MSKPGTLSEVAAVFFKLGCIAFGGPAAHIAMLEAEVVVKRKWMDRQHFLDAVNVAAIAVMASVLFEMSRDTLTDWRALLIAAFSVVVAFGFKKISALWMVLGGAVLGYLLWLI